MFVEMTKARKSEPIINSVSLVVPVYNSEESLPRLSTDIFSALKGLSDLEVVFVDDGSTDGSWNRIEVLAKTDSRIHGIRLQRNFGQHNATLAGVRAARNEFILTMDDDLQFSPESFWKLEEALRLNKVDLVYGQPDLVKQKFHRRLLSRLAGYVISKAMNSPSKSRPTSLRLFKTSLRESFSSYVGPAVSLDALLLWGTQRVAYSKVAHSPRLFGKSNYSTRRLVGHGIRVLTSFSVMPLRAVALIGIISAAFGFLFLVITVSTALFNERSVPGFATLASLVALFSGLQLIGLGIIAEYLAQIHFRAMGAPSYSVEKSTRGKKGKAPNAPS